MLPNLTDQFIADTYKGILHTSNTPISSVDIPVFDGVGNRTALNIGASGASITIDGTVKADKFTVKGYDSIIDYLFPINSIYLSVDNMNPSIRFVGTLWEQITQGRFLVSVGTGVDINSTSRVFASGDNNGEYDVTLTASQLPAHNHLNGVRTVIAGARQPHIYGSTRLDMEENTSTSNPDYSSVPVGVDEPSDVFNSTNIQGYTSKTGSDQSHNNTPPSFGLYVWKRIM